jgi:hypothetical protein
LKSRAARVNALSEPNINQKEVVMKTNINMEKEVVVNLPDDLGVLSRISTALSEARVNIKAVCAYAVDDDAHVRLVTDNNGRAMDVLKRAGFTASEHDVVRCEVSPNMLHPEIGSALSGYEVDNNYWCAAAHRGEHAVLYFTLRDNIHHSGVR